MTGLFEERKASELLKHWPPGMVRACNPSTPEAESQVQRQLEPPSETLYSLER